MLSKVFQIQPSERRLFGWSAAWFSTVLAAYYIVRPIREAMGSIEGRKGLAELFTATFLTMLIAVPVYSQLVNRFSRRRLVPIIYRFLQLNLVGFSVAMNVVQADQLKQVANVFFVWVAVYGLFMTSLFWSVMADIYNRADGKRLFGTIAGCGTLGSIAASFGVGAAAENVGTQTLLLLSAALMEIGLLCFRLLTREKDRLAESHPSTQPAADPEAADETQSDSQRPSGNLFSGFLQVIKSPYLRSIMLFTLCTTCCGTFLYLTQAEMLRQAYPDDDARTAAFARIDLFTQILTLIFQLLVAARLMSFSLTLTVCALPLVYVLGILGLAATPSLSVLIVLMVLSRSSTYGLAVPSIGVLYTVVSREDKYKAKSVIDTLVIRGGDVSCNWAIQGLRNAGRSATFVAWAVLPVAVLSVALGCLLSYRNGRAQARSAG